MNEYKKAYEDLLSLKRRMVDEQDYETAASLSKVEHDMFLKEGQTPHNFSVEEFNIRLCRAIQPNIKIKYMSDTRAAASKNKRLIEIMDTIRDGEQTIATFEPVKVMKAKIKWTKSEKDLIRAIVAIDPDNKMGELHLDYLKNINPDRDMDMIMMKVDRIRKKHFGLDPVYNVK